MNRIRTTTAIVAAGLLGAAVQGDTIEQSGSLSGAAGPPKTHEIVLDQFDSMGGTRRLNHVQIDLLTSTIGGGSTNGSGVPVDIDVTLSADYALDGEILAETAAVIDTTIPNSGTPTSFTLFDTDTEQVTVTPPVDTAPWVGSGEITVTAVTELSIVVTPPDEIAFSAGGTVTYAVIYDYDLVPLPGDVDEDGSVTVLDLVEVILAWGPCPPSACPADVDGNGIVDVADLVIVILNWS